MPSFGKAFWLAGALVLASACGGDTKEIPGEVNILTGPRFWTGDPTHPWAEALVVSQGRIVDWTDRVQIPRLIAQGGTVRNLPGIVAVPGLTDAHGHLRSFSMSLRNVNLRGAKSVEEALARVERFAAEHPEERWITGRSWDQNDWPDHAWPDADRLEQVVPGRPCALWRVDGHALWVNRTALAEAKIDAKTKDPAGGAIHRDRGGRPTGILIDEAAVLVQKWIPPPTPQQLESAMAEAAERLLALGLTGFHDMGMESESRDVLERLAESGRFPLRVAVYAEYGTPLAQEFLTKGLSSKGRLDFAGIKLYADGALGSRGARLLEPYSDDPRNRGLWVTEPAELAARLRQCAEHGLQPAVHAIGDAANRATLDAIEALEKDLPKAKALRPRVEHAQILDPQDSGRLAALGATASMQPTHATSDMPWVEDRIGRQRLSGAYAWRTVLSRGAALAFGSDFPVEWPDPLAGLYSAITRQDPQGRPANGWLPEQRLKLTEALAAFTEGAAFAIGKEKEQGRIAPGYWCDLTVLDRDIFKNPPASLLETKVVATVIGGQVVWPISTGNKIRSKH